MFTRRTDRPPGTTAASSRSPIQLAALVVGATFLLVGVLGFVPGITKDLDNIEFAGPDSGAELLGLFQVSILHNIVHLLFGVVGLTAAKAMPWARLFLIGGGVVYLVLWIYGLVVDETSDANFVPLNDADNWLHFGLGVGMIGLGYVLSQPMRTTQPAANGNTTSSAM